MAQNLRGEEVPDFCYMHSDARAWNLSAKGLVDFKAASGVDPAQPFGGRECEEMAHRRIVASQEGFAE